MKLLNTFLDVILFTVATLIALLAIPPGLAVAALFTLARCTAGLTTASHAIKNP